MSIIGSPVILGEPSCSALLAQNLTFMGVSASASEDTTALCAKVLKILQGDTTVSWFAASISPATYPADYNYLVFDESASPGTLITVAALCRIASVTLRFEGSGAGNLSFTASGWTVTTDESSGTVAKVLTRTLTDANTRADLIPMLNAIGVSASAEADVTLTVTAVGSVATGYDETEEEVEGETVTVQTPVYPTFTATGSCRIRFLGTTWQVVQAVYSDWESLEDDDLTWTALESVPKPEAGE